jgi:hypothetical protein
MKTFVKIFQSLIFTVVFLHTTVNIIAQDRNKPRPPKSPGEKRYTIEQAISERAQLHTVAFNGLAFITGSFGADCFFPPGKVADFFGFQYMRDNDKNEMGHNTDFLTRIANNVMNILTDEQLQQLKELANKQASVYDEFAKSRMVLIKAFRNQLENTIPIGKKELSKEEVIKYCAKLYELDAELSYSRAVVVGKVINSFSDIQKKDLANLDFGNSSTWKDLPESLDKRSLSHRAHVGVMTYASELFSWYAGSVEADVYFCPERHGTYFGGFFLKDYPAMGNRDYKISTSLTGDKGNDFINMLTSDLADELKKIIKDQEPILKEIVQIRTDVAIELRKAMKSEMPNKEKVFSLIKRYGKLDGEMSYNYSNLFAKINSSLTQKQKEQLFSLRDLNVVPQGAYLFSDPVKMPDIQNSDLLFK